jgi:hypothetical protein
VEQNHIEKDWPVQIPLSQLSYPLAVARPVRPQGGSRHELELVVVPDLFLHARNVSKRFASIS